MGETLAAGMVALQADKGRAFSFVANILNPVRTPD
jgi:hypothetical protein